MARNREGDGFTLLEVAVVVIIISLITAAGAFVGKGVMEEARQTQTRNKLTKIKDALQAFREKNNRLPCPGAQSSPEGSPTYGDEAQRLPAGGQRMVQTWTFRDYLTMSRGLAGGIQEPARPRGWRYHTTNHPDGRGHDILAHHWPTVPLVFHARRRTRPPVGTTADVVVPRRNSGPRSSDRHQFASAEPRGQASSVASGVAGEGN